MDRYGIGRRTFVAGVAAFSAARALPAFGQTAVPNSVGTNTPKLKAPDNATDCHMHIYDPARFYMPPNQRVAPTNATVEDYRLLQKRNGTTRVRWAKGLSTAEVLAAAAELPMPFVFQPSRSRGRRPRQPATATRRAR